MAKKEPTVAWQVLLDDSHWEQDAQLPTTDLADVADERPRRWRRLSRPWLIGFALIITVALGVGGWFLWQRAQHGLAQIEAEIETVVLAESAVDASQNSLLAQALLDPATSDEWRARIVSELIDDDSAAPASVVEDVELLDGVAIVSLVTTDPDLPRPSRTVRFYRESPAGWLRTSPVPLSWGAGEQWSGEQFVFRFRARDRHAVLAAAPQIEAAYVQMRQHLGLPILPDRQTIVVLPDDQPLAFDFPSKELRLPSPQLLNLPAGLDEETALLRTVTLYLINDLVRESFDRYSNHPIWIWSNLTESGLRNWLQLESGVLGVERKSILVWLFDADAQIERRLPAHVVEECQAMDALAVRVLLLACTPDIPPPLSTPASALRLSRLATTYDYDFAKDASIDVTPSGPMWHTEGRQEIVATMTVYLYAVDTYGVERFPVLLEALGDYRGWFDAIPAAYGISAEEFEVGWLAWLATEFGIGE